MKDVNDIQPSTSIDSNHTKNDHISRKRRASSSIEGDATAKRFIAQDDDDGSFKLLDFTDEVLLEILKHCDNATLYAISKTCKHFAKLVEDRSLWRQFDFSTRKMMGRRIKKLLSTMQIGDIYEFRVRGFVSKYPLEKWKNNTITPNILRKLSSSCPNLEKVEIIDGYINFSQIKISDFPTTLKQLIFNGCQITLPRTPKLFQKIDEHLQLLEEISLEKCAWFETHDLIVLSKLPHLKRLILRGCESLKESVPYGSIAARFGFKSLEYLDVRDTPITDSDIQCFNVTTTLREILMDCPVGLRSEESDTQDAELSSADDSDSSDDEDSVSIKNPIDGQKTTQNDPISEAKSETDDESDCSSDSEDDNDDGAAATSENKEEVNTPQAQCIQVILQNGRMINVNAERSNEQENALRNPNALRCVIGIINGRDSGGESFCNRIVVHRSQKPPSNQSDESNGQSSNASSDSTSSAESSKNVSDKIEPKKTDGTDNGNATNTVDSSSGAGPSGLQTQHDSTKASKSNSPGNNEHSNDEAGPSNRNAGNPNEQNPPNVEVRQRVIIVQHRHHNNNDEIGNLNRQISWRLRNMHPVNNTGNRIEQPSFFPFTNNGFYITDRGMCSFGMPRRNVQEGIIWIRAELRPPDTLLERITVRNYKDVTDITLRHLALCAPNLRYLDVTGTSVTRKGITIFLKEKPECQVISELLDT